MYNLVIIDCQYCFAASKKVVPGVLSAIRKAKNGRNPIILVEYDIFADKKETLKEIKEELKNYKHHTIVKKHKCDGSEALLKELNNSDKYANRFRFCGVEIDCCVEQTIEGMLKQNLNPSSMAVLYNAVAAYKKHNKYPAIKRLKLNGVRIV